MQAMMAAILMHEATEEEEESEAHGEEIDPEWEQEKEKQREVEKVEAEAEASRWIECPASWKPTPPMDEVKKTVEARPEWSMWASKTQ